MRIKNLCKSLAKRLGMVAVAGGMSFGLASDGYAAIIAVGDSSFEDHTVDSGSNYAYGAAGQAGGDTGFNNPSAINGGVSPWNALATYGNGIGGDNASWMQNSGYSPPNTGDQSAEVQGMLAQNLIANFIVPGKDYFVTVAARNDDHPDGIGDLQVGLYDASAVTLIP
ncbi:MAG: hypothetical protein ACR2NU_04830, partial [Aeoliella sp.]